MRISPPCIPQQHQEQESIWNRQFVCIFIANALLYLGLYMVQPLITSYVYTLGATDALIGFVAGSFAVTSLLFKLIAAPAIDSFRKVLVTRCALIIMTIAFLGYSMSTSVSTIIVFRLLHGVALAFTSSCFLSLATDFLPPKKLGAGIGIFSTAMSIGQAIAPAIGLKIADCFSYSTCFFIAALMGICSVLLTFVIRSSEPLVKRKFQVSVGSFVAKEALFFAFLIMVLSCCFCLINAHMVIYAGQRNIENIGYYFTVYAVTLLITRPLLGKLSDRFGSVQVLIPALLCFAIAFFIISYAASLLAFLLAAVVSAFGFGAAYPVINTLSMKSVAPDRYGASSSTNYIGMDLGNLLGPIIASFFIMRLGYPAMWRIMTILIFISIVLLFLFRRYVFRIEAEFRERTQTQ